MWVCVCACISLFFSRTLFVVGTLLMMLFVVKVCCVYTTSRKKTKNTLARECIKKTKNVKSKILNALLLHNGRRISNLSNAIVANNRIGNSSNVSFHYQWREREQEHEQKWGSGGVGQIERKFCSTFDVEQYHFHRTHLVNAVLWRLDLVEQFANALVCSCAAEWIHRTIIRSHTETTQWQTPKQNVLRMFKAINFQCVQKEEWKKMRTTAAAAAAAKQTRRKKERETERREKKLPKNKIKWNKRRNGTSTRDRETI